MAIPPACRNCIIRDRYFFRVYALDRKSYTDYTLRTEDIQITLRGNYCCLVEDETGNFIDDRTSAERRAGRQAPA